MKTDHKDYVLKNNTYNGVHAEACVLSCWTVGTKQYEVSGWHPDIYITRHSLTEMCKKSSFSNFEPVEIYIRKVLNIDFVLFHIFLIETLKSCVLKFFHCTMFKCY